MISAGCPDCAPQADLPAALPFVSEYYTWNESDIAAFEAYHAYRHQAATRARAVALHRTTERRRAAHGRQHIREGVLTVRQNKTGATLAIPVHSDLQGHPRGHAERHT